MQAQDSRNVTITVDQEFKALIPPLTDEEFAGLERSILEEGVREPIVTWRGVIVDGHNRYEIATGHGLDFDTVEYDFASRDDAMLWMIDNQCGRRNLAAIDRILLEQKRAAITREKARQKQSDAGGDRRSAEYRQKTASVQMDKSGERIDTRAEIAKKADVSKGTVARVEQIQKNAPELIDEIRAGNQTIGGAYKQIQDAQKKERKAEEIRQAQSYIESQESGGGSAVLRIGDSVGKTVECDLLLTDPPYSTDVDDIEAFAESWLPAALEGVRPTGFAYVFIGAYPDELRAYLNVEAPEHLELAQVLVWTYKNTLGNNPKARYKQNYQACLFFRGVDAPDLDCPLTSEQWAVQEINAPDGRLGDRYHAWQKPLEIAERFVRHSTREGMTVYDPFACTGTFLVAAAKLGRRGVGYELDPDNAEIAYGRGVSRG